MDYGLGDDEEEEDWADEQGGAEGPHPGDDEDAGGGSSSSSDGGGGVPGGAAAAGAASGTPAQWWRDDWQALAGALQPLRLLQLHLVHAPALQVISVSACMAARGAVRLNLDPFPTPYTLHPTPSLYLNPKTIKP